MKRLRSTEEDTQTPVIVMSGINAPYIQEAAAKTCCLGVSEALEVDEYLPLGFVVQDLLRRRIGAV